jgi:hypothetical protein
MLHNVQVEGNFVISLRMKEGKIVGPEKEISENSLFYR